jgi:DNA-binding transcriptional LysR family regulator
VRNLNDIAIFVRVVEKKSFSAAAKELGLSPSFVSKRVRSLEEELKTLLLKRSTHFLSLTEGGEAFYTRCAEALNLLDGAQSEAIDRTDEMRGNLRLFAALGFGEYVLWKIAAAFAEQHPQIAIELEIGNRSTNVLEIGVDIAIRSADLPDSSLAHRDLGSLRYHICAAPSYLAKAGRPESPKDLPRFNCLIHTAHVPADRWRFADRGGDDYIVRVTGNVHSNSGVAIHGSCERGVGLARLPNYIVDRAVAEGRLEILFPGKLQFERQLKAFYPRTPHIPAKVLKFLDFLQERVPQELATGPSFAPLVTRKAK